MDEFYSEFMKNLGSEGSVATRKAELTTYVCQVLEERADIRDFSLAAYEGHGIYLDAYSWAEDLGRLTLFITDFSEDLGSVEALTQSNVDRSFKRVKGFLDKSRGAGLHNKIDTMEDAYWAARIIAENEENIGHVHYVLISNKQLSQRFESVRAITTEGITESYDIWDIGRIYRLFDQPIEPLLIDFCEFYKDGIPCLKAFNDSDVCESYLLAMPGTLLAKIYERYGDRLLEQNVRTFLQFRGKVNRAIRQTLVQEPDMFFAYNNGLTMTAETVSFSGHSMLQLENPQIVNGGQTTASIFMAKYKEKEHKIDLDKVHIPVKLTVVKPEKVDEIVPVISKCANTQNKVSDSDFFSNHPFHQRVKEMSSRIVAPAKVGAHRDTFWFYERSRGQFANETVLMTPAQKNNFLKSTPKHQVIDKTQLSKYENVFRCSPHKASSGAQASFSHFANLLCGEKGLWERNSAQFGDAFFKELVAKAILFQALDKAIARSEWYERHKAAVVCYTLAKFMDILTKRCSSLDFAHIWKLQDVPDDLMNDLLSIAEVVQDFILEAPGNGYWRKVDCWREVQNIEVEISDLDQEYVIPEEQVKATKKEQNNSGKVLNEVEGILSLLEQPDGEKPLGYWRTLSKWANEKPGLMTYPETNLLSNAANSMIELDNLKRLEKIIKKAEYNGFIFA